MAAKRDNYRLGITIIVMFVLFFSCLLFIGSKGLFEAEKREFIVRFEAGPAMAEIVPGSRVTCFGQAVGKVLDTGYVKGDDPQDPRRTDVQFLEVRATALAELDLRSDAKVLATGPPLGGKGMLEVSSRGVAAEPLAPGVPLYGQTVGLQAALSQLTTELDVENPQGLLSLVKLQMDSGDERSLLAKVHHSVEDINVMTGNLARELELMHDTTLLAKVHGGLDKVNVALAEMVELMRDNRPRIDRTLASVEHATEALDTQIVSALAEELDASREASMLAEAHTALARLNESLADINEITSRSERVVVLNAERIDELVENATQASSHLHAGIKDLKLHPWKLLFPPSTAEKEQLHTLSIVRQFADAATRLDDATSRLKALADAHGGQLAGDDRDLLEIRAELAASVERFYEAERVLWQEMKAE